MERTLHADRSLIRAGAVTLVVVAAAMILLVGKGSCQWRDTTQVTVYFAHAEGLREGAAVRAAGREIGRVDSVALVRHGDVAGTAHLLADTGGVAVILSIETRRAAMAAADGEYFLASQGIFGERYVEIGPPPRPWPGTGVDAHVRVSDRAELRGVDPANVDRAFIRTYDNMLLFRRFIDDVGPESRALAVELARLGVTLASLEPEPGAWSALVTAANGLVAELAAVRATWQATGVSAADLERLRASVAVVGERAAALVSASRTQLAHLSAELERVRGHIPDDVRARLAKAVATAETSLAKLDAIGAAARDLADRVARGEGTVGALINDPEFTDDAKSVGKSIKRQPWRLIGRPRATVD